MRAVTREKKGSARGGGGRGGGKQAGRQTEAIEKKNDTSKSLSKSRGVMDVTNPKMKKKMNTVQDRLRFFLFLFSDQFLRRRGAFVSSHNGNRMLATFLVSSFFWGVKPSTYSSVPDYSTYVLHNVSFFSSSLCLHCCRPFLSFFPATFFLLTTGPGP